jgi:hypothetical protein
MKPHYTGSIAFDDHNDKWADELVLAFEYNDFVKDMQTKMGRRQNSEVFFASFIDKNGREHDITSKVRESCG